MVTGVRASLENAQDLKRENAQVIDSIVAEDIGKLPDNNVADALARVTGVQIRRDSGEGNAVLVRGLPNITTLLNGREVFTTTSRFIALADIPATMLKRVDVYKTNGAELLEGGIAGTIDVRTRRPFDAPGFHANANIRGVYSDKAKDTDPDLGLMLSDTWDTNMGGFGALIGASYTPRNYHEERAFNVAPEPVSNQFNVAHPPPVPNIRGPFVVGQIPIAGDRRRTAFNMALEWRPSEASKIYLDGFQTDYKNDFELDFFVGLPWLGNGDVSATVFPGTNQTKTITNHDVFTITSTQANRAHSITRQLALGGSYELDNGITFSTDFSNTTSKNDFQNPIMDVSTIVPVVNVDTNHDGTVLLSYGGPNYDIKDGRNYNIANWFDNFGRDDGKAFDWRGDVKWQPASSGVLSELSAGLRYADRDASSIRSFGGAAYPFRSTPTSTSARPRWGLGGDGLRRPALRPAPVVHAEREVSPREHRCRAASDRRPVQPRGDSGSRICHSQRPGDVRAQARSGLVLQRQGGDEGAVRAGSARRQHGFRNPGAQCWACDSFAPSRPSAATRFPA